MKIALFAVINLSDIMDEELVRIQKDDFDIDGAIRIVKSKTNKIGGIVTFLGSVRSISRGREVEKLKYSVYEDMTKQKMSEIREEALKGEGVHEVLIYHRYGELDLGENTILIIVGGEHREEAYATSRSILERVKAEVPVWKKEITADGEHWIEGD